MGRIRRIAEPQRPSSARNAFTLIELLVTVVILSTGIVLILQAFQTSMIALATSRDTMRSASLRHALMVQAEVKVMGSDAGVPDQTLRPLYPDYRWRVDTRTDADVACTNSVWIKHEVVAMVQHKVTGRESVAETWVQAEGVGEP